MTAPKGGKMIQSVQRAVDIINCFDDVNTELTLSQISQKLDLNKSTVHGILNTLHNNNFVRQNFAGHYMLGQSLIRKYHFADSAKRTLLLEEAKAEMARIANENHVNSSLFMHELGELVLVNRILPENEVYTISGLSDSYLNPLYCTASGKLLLAWLSPENLEKYLERHELIPHTPRTITSKEFLLEHLTTIRKDGVAFETEELGLGVSAISVPIFDPHSNLFGTASITGMAVQVEARKAELIFDLKTLSRTLTQRIF